MTTVVVLQPGYLPWIGFFDQLARSDAFVFYDDVQYDKNGWRNRNRVKGQDGSPLWLTVPVRLKGHFGARVMDVEIDSTQKWVDKHLRTLEQLYRREPCFDRVFPAVAEVVRRKHGLLVDLDLELVEVLRKILGLERRIVRSSQLDIHGGQTERLVRFCQHFGATRYLTGDSAEAYLDQAAFTSVGIEVEFHRYRHPVYPQGDAPFVPFLSIVDLLFRQGGSAALECLRSRAAPGSSPARPPTP